MPPQNDNPQPGPSLPQPSGPELPPVGPPTGQTLPTQPMPQASSVPQGYNPVPYPDTAAGVPKLRPTNIDPDNLSTDAPKQEQDRYAFFMESKPDGKKSILPLPKSGNKFGWLIAGAAVFFIILGAAAFFLNANKASQAQGDPATFVGIINQQQEILRLSNLGEKNVRSGELANFVATARVSTISSQQELITYVTKNGVTVDSKALAAYKADPKTDKVLDSALSASTYDSTYQRIMSELLTDYTQNLQRLEAKSVDKAERDIISKEAAKAELLRGMVVQE